MSDRASSPPPPPVSTSKQMPETTDADVEIKEEESLSTSLPSPTTSAAQTETNFQRPSSSPSRTIRRTEGQRRAMLRDDPQVQEVEPQRVMCRVCQKWIRLATNCNYVLNNWRSHKQRCRGSPSAPRSVRRTPSKPNFNPGSRVATTERRIALLNDPQVKTCSPLQVQCGSCMSTVALEGEVEYDLTKWTEHKLTCIPMTPAPITPISTSHRARVVPTSSTSSVHSQVSAGRSSPTPIEGSNSNSTETTAVTDSSPVVATAGTKRAREEELEEEEGEEAVDEHPNNRPRTETYEPPTKEAPSMLGWFMQPLKEFARGFREGLGST